MQHPVLDGRSERVSRQGAKPAKPRRDRDALGSVGSWVPIDRSGRSKRRYLGPYRTVRGIEASYLEDLRLGTAEPRPRISMTYASDPRSEASDREGLCHGMAQPRSPVSPSYVYGP